MRRIDRIAMRVSAGHRFVWGIFMLLIFLFSRGLAARLGMTIFFAFMAEVSGKRIHFAYFAFMVVSITAFNLLTPWGEILLSIGRFSITRGALTAGLVKGITICGLVFVSLFSVSRHLALPGRLGRLLGRSFYYFESLYSMKKKVRRRTFFQDIDTILLSIFPSPEAAVSESSPIKTGVSGRIIITASLLFCLSLLVAGYRGMFFF